MSPLWLLNLTRRTLYTISILIPIPNSKTFFVFSGFFDKSKAQIADLAKDAASGFVDFYDSSAVKSVNDAIMKVNDLLIALYFIEQTNPNADGKNELR